MTMARCSFRAMLPLHLVPSFAGARHSSLVPPAYGDALLPTAVRRSRGRVATTARPAHTSPGSNRRMPGCSGSGPYWDALGLIGVRRWLRHAGTTARPAHTCPECRRVPPDCQGLWPCRDALVPTAAPRSRGRSLMMSACCNKGCASVERARSSRYLPAW